MVLEIDYFILLTRDSIFCIPTYLSLILSDKTIPVSFSLMEASQILLVISN